MGKSDLTLGNEPLRFRNVSGGALASGKPPGGPANIVPITTIFSKKENGNDTGKKSSLYTQNKIVSFGQYCPLSQLLLSILLSDSYDYYLITTIVLFFEYNGLFFPLSSLYLYYIIIMMRPYCFNHDELSKKNDFLQSHSYNIMTQMEEK